MNSERGHIRRYEDTSDREGRAELATAFVEIRAKNRGRKRRIDETCRDQIDADWRELQGEVGDEWRISRREP